MIRLSHPTGKLSGTVKLPSSKSESNRMLILQALSRGLIQVSGLSSAKDTQTLQKLLQENPETMDVGHAGTAMRFLTAYLAFQMEDKVLTGSNRMQERPIALLVDALRKMGADIQYMHQDGYPPLMIFGKNCRFGDSEVEIPGNVSSQYLSALLMIAPTLPDGLRLHITGHIGSRPYIEMTLALMAEFGIQYSWEGATIHIAKQLYQAGHYEVEADWSAASYWFCMAGLANEADFNLPGLRQNSLQGDHVIAEILQPFGIESTWQAGGLQLQQLNGNVPSCLEWDFSDCPDLAQGLLVMLAAKGINARFSGLESLRIKETDRIAALQNELGKFGVQLLEQDGVWELAGKFEPRKATIRTYQDHRMAMAFAPLALICPEISIEESDVVQKSYPEFWEELRGLGFVISS